MQVIYSHVGNSNPFYVVYFMLAWFEGWQICVDTTLIIGFTYVVCKHDEIIGRVKAHMWSVFWFNFMSFTFEPGQMYAWVQSDSNASQKSKKKQADCRICLSWVLRNVKGYKLVHVRNRCRNVWVVSMYTCHFKWIFSVFRLQPLLHLCHILLLVE